MNFRRQVVSLIKYDSLISPVIWVFCGVMLLQLMIFQQTKFHNSLMLLTFPFRTLIWIPFMLASFLFSQNILTQNKWTTPQTQRMSMAMSLEFLLTRPVDRLATFWSRNILYWIMVLLPLSIWIVIAVINPSLTLEVTEKAGGTMAKTNYYLNHIPGSEVLKSASNGNATIYAAHGTLWLKLSIASSLIIISMFYHALLLTLAQYRYAKVIFWSVFALCILIPALLDVYRASHILEAVIFFPIEHFYIALALFAVLLAFILTQGKKSFLQQEFS